MPTTPLRYHFFDDQLAAALSLMTDQIRIFGIAAGIAIIIACLGLLGMATYSAETRIKEIGIRKVLGADMSNLVLLLSRDYLVLLVIAILMASPLTWWINSGMLANYAVRIDLGFELFAIGILTVLTLALLTIGSQTLKAARTNPAGTIKYE